MTRRAPLAGEDDFVLVRIDVRVDIRFDVRFGVFDFAERVVFLAMNRGGP